MSRDEILTNFQKEALKEVGKSELSRFFVWSGGTALSFYYLQHRLSVDLDFMSQDSFRDEYLLTEIGKIAENLGVRNIEEQKKFNRHEFWLKKGKEILRIEFVFYPFPRIRPPQKLKEFNIKIDSIEDMLTNKAQAAYERSEPKDIFDLYCILLIKKINFFRIFKWVEKKFGVKIDPVLFTSKALEGAEKLKEMRPLRPKKKFFKPSSIKIYFQKQAEIYLKKKITC
ncbi:nucleotidyl transferase AbiEii/AbiGii toxin family protein [Patescibacteria group bacterium]|nr:nucleotidyl transferase AbiEii/AbiGii toxin family protein [Patescibacteria group bacterium]